MTITNSINVVKAEQTAQVQTNRPLNSGKQAFINEVDTSHLPRLSREQTTQAKRNAVELYHNPKGLNSQEQTLLKQAVRVGLIYDREKFGSNSDQAQRHDFCNHATIRYLAEIVASSGSDAETAMNVLQRITGKTEITPTDISAWSLMETMVGDISASSYAKAVEEVQSQSSRAEEVITPEQYRAYLNGSLN